MVQSEKGQVGGYSSTVMGSAMLYLVSSKLCLYGQTQALVTAEFTFLITVEHGMFTKWE